MSYSNQLLSLLNDYKPSDPNEILCKSEMIAFAKAHSNCFERTLSIGHFTASSWVISKDGSKALLMHHTKLDRWFQLGGHADGDSDLLAVAIKEAREESGIEGISPVSAQIFDIDIHEIPANSRDPAHFHYDVRFLLQVVSDEEVIQNRESKELRWISRAGDNLPTSEPSVTRMFDKWKRLKG